MLSYIIRRLLLMVPTLLGMTMVIFFTMALAPGGTGASLLSHEGEMRPQERKALQDYLNKRYGLDKPPIVQYLRWLNHVSPIGVKEQPTPLQAAEIQRRYNAEIARGMSSSKAVANLTSSIPWLKAVEVTPNGEVLSSDVKTGEGWPRSWPFGLKVPDLGESFARQRPVIDLISEALPITLLLNLITVPIIYTIGIFVGIHAARHRGKFVDVASGTLLLGLWSLPTILAGVLLIGFLANNQYIRLFPTNGLHDLQADAMTFLPSWGQGGFERGWLLDTCWHLVLPIFVLSYGGFAFLTKLQRSSILENIGQDYVRTARAKGLAEKTVLYGHVLRNSLIPMITVAASILPGLLGGSIVVERIFGISGMGNLMVDAVFMRDRELVLSDALVVSLIGLLSYLVVDILYVVADPRVSFE